MSKADKLLKRVEFYEKMASAQKPEAGDLLNKASLFERLALYSDRQSFLQALAQTSTLTATFGPAVREQLESVTKDLGALNIQDPSIVGPISNALGGFSSLDKNGLISALEAAAAKFPQTPDHASQLQNLQNLISTLKGSGPQSEPADETMYMPADKIKGFAPIDTEQQEALSRFITMQRLGIPLHRIDGKLGPETRAAIEAARKYLTEKSPNKQKLNDKQVLETIKFIVDNAPETYGTS